MRLIGALAAAFALALFASAPVSAQEVAAGPILAKPFTSVSQPTQIAQLGVTGVIPTDVTPSSLGQERQLVSPGFVFRAFQKVPARLWFNATTEVTQRLETNVFFTARNAQADYVFRVLPNITLGYSILDNTSLYCNYFVIKDVYAINHELTFPTTQSLSVGLRHNRSLGRRTNLQFDFIPGLTVTHVLHPEVVAFGNVQLQMRGRNYFVAPTRELDPFYSVGLLVKKGAWTFSATDTFVTNFRSPPFHGSVPNHGNVSMIADFEIDRPVYKKNQGLVWFVRAEPIWNWRSAAIPGLSGFDFRFYSGIRATLGKPSLASSINTLRRQIIEGEGLNEDDGQK